MTAKKQRKGGGRVTPKGTVNPTGKKRRGRDEPKPDVPTNELPPVGAGKQNRHSARPISHNRGNR